MTARLVRWRRLLPRRAAPPLARVVERLCRANHGWSAGLAGWPARACLAGAVRRTGLFDSYAYAAATGLSGRSEKALIDHYLRTPPHLRPSPQPRFDAERYRFLAGLDPKADAFLHFAVRRFDRDDALSAAFSVRAYLRDNPDIRVAGLEAMRHYLERGWREGRLSCPPAPARPLPDFDDVIVRAGGSLRHDAIDVVVPIYGGRAETLACLHSVLAAKTEIDYRLIAIDDSSPDPLLSADLADLAGRGLIHGLTNPQNLGFTATANRGLALSPERDVVLLNSDTEVYDGWLDRLRAHAYAGAGIGTVTPLSNAATILSYPVRLRDNPAPLELSYRELSALAGRLRLPPVDIPTAVGFCMYVRRACLDDVGMFDVTAFPTGYGEENDFCLRATARGWRHLAATDVFVKHLGSRSFGARRGALVAAGMAVLKRRYPSYQEVIDRFIAKDALGVARAALDIARVRRAGSPLRLVHCGAQARSGPCDLVLRKAPGVRDRFVVHAPWCLNTPNLPDLRPVRDPEAAIALLRELDVAGIIFTDRGVIEEDQFTAFRKVAAEMNVVFRAG